MGRLIAIDLVHPGGVPATLNTILAGSTWADRPHRRLWRSDYVGGAWWGWSDPQIASADGVTVALDGHIYNRRSFGLECANDAAIVAERYHSLGFINTIRELNGDFALVLHDEAASILWLARDRFGVKPLYYTQTAAGFACASQPRALLGFTGVDDSVDAEFVGLFAGSHYRYFDNNPERSPFASVRQLPAAHVLKVHHGVGVQPYRYWALTNVPNLPETGEELAAAYRELLLDAVAVRRDGATRPAFTLSGGMDSSTVLASAVHSGGQTEQAFSTVYDDPTYDESADIAAIRGQYVSEWHPIRVGTPDVLATVERMVQAHDEPVATATWLSHFLLCEAVADAGFGSLFGGLGGDELNAGEYEHFLYYFADLRASGDEDRLSHEVACWARHHDHPIHRKSMATVKNAFATLIDFGETGRCRSDRTRLDRYAAALNRDYFDVRAFAPVMDHPFASYLKNRTFQDLTRETIPCCLRAEDRHTEAFGLDVRLPFFDFRLAEFMFRVPGTLKFRDGVGKFLLREAMRGVLPEETRTRVKKTGWNAPAHVWFAGEGRTMLDDLVRSQRFRERGIYDMREVERIIDEHDDIMATGRPQENHMMFLWQLVNLELWLRTCADTPGVLSSTSSLCSIERSLEDSAAKCRQRIRGLTQ